MKLPIYNKAFEILETVKLIGDIIPEDHQQLQTIKGLMMEDALLLCSKIVGAESVDLYDIKMKN